MMNRMHTASGLWHEVWWTNVYGVAVGVADGEARLRVTSGGSGFAEVIPNAKAIPTKTAHILITANLL